MNSSLDRMGEDAESGRDNATHPLECTYFLSIFISVSALLLGNGQMRLCGTEKQILCSLLIGVCVALGLETGSTTSLLPA